MERIDGAALALIQAHEQGWDWSDGEDHEPSWKINLSEVAGEFFLVEVGDSTSITALGRDKGGARSALAARIEEAEDVLAASRDLWDL